MSARLDSNFTETTERLPANSVGLLFPLTMPIQ
jgi:hypothetical protein